MQVILFTRPDVLLQRYAQRVDSGKRHPGHVDRLQMGEFDPEKLRQCNQPLALDGPVIRIDTTDFSTVDANGLVARLQSIKTGVESALAIQI